jgi:hypothetical protein
MPYLEREWMIGTEKVHAGAWVPERNWDRWQRRAAASAPGELSWRSEPNPSPPPTLSDASLTVLAGDIVSAQRDALVYGNLIERLKNSPSDATAGEVVEQMQTLGFVSASWPEAVGGPPAAQSPRPFRRVLDWLLGLAAKVARFLLSCVECAMASLASLGVTAVALGVSWAPEVSFEFPTDMHTPERHEEWRRARQFLDDMLTELDQKVFSS